MGGLSKPACRPSAPGGRAKSQLTLAVAMAGKDDLHSVPVAVLATEREKHLQANALAKHGLDASSRTTRDDATL